MHAPETSSRPRGTRGQRHRTAQVLVGALGVVALVATSGALVSAQTTGGFGGGRFGGGGTGKLTGKSGSTLEIEGFTGTTSKVIVTDSTKYRQVADTDSSAVAKGACIRVASDDQGGTSATTPPTTTTPSTTPSTTTAPSGTAPVTATRVTVVDATQCAARQGTTRRFPNRGGGTANGEGAPSGSFPEGGSAPTGRSFPNGATRAFGGGVTGKVKSVDGDTVVVTSRRPKRPSSSSGKVTFTTQNVTVTLTSSTTYQHTVAATDTVLVVGTCVATQGSSDSVGTVTAKTVTASQPDSDGSCTGGFTFPGGATPPTDSTNGQV